MPVVVDIRRWQDDAACRAQPDLFFGPFGESKDERAQREQAAKALCARCPVRVECAAAVRARPEKYGVWGEQGEIDRREARRRARRAELAQARRQAS